MKTTVLSMFATILFILAGCQGGAMDKKKTNQSETPITATGQYGRGAKSDGQDTNAKVKPAKKITQTSQAIIIYFSRSGNTENLANAIEHKTNADLLELELVTPYPANYDKTLARANQERESQTYPAIKTKIPDLSQYKTIYLGYQTWDMTLSNPMTSFLEANGRKLTSKHIFPFSTNAGYGEGDTLDKIKEFAPGATIEPSFSIEDKDVTAKTTQDNLDQWIKKSE